MEFLIKVFKELNNVDVDITSFEIDHLCYRTSSLKNYQEIKDKFSKEARLLIESDVNGRPIATFKLHSPIFFKDWIIDLVEVPAPKEGRETQEGYEHIEVVIDQSFDEFIERHPKIEFNKNGLSKELNPELEVEFEDCAVKFHHKSLEHIIAIEKNKEVLSFLKKSNILSNLSNFTPCISGTLPLEIAHRESDLDILFYAADLNFFEERVLQLFKSEEDFFIKRSHFQGQESIVANFKSAGLPVELFCQKKPVFNQQANLHFLIEGRLLKILGSKFKERVLELKLQGLKTEPAFGTLLNLNKPYQDLIDLHQLSDIELYEKFKDSI